VAPSKSVSSTSGRNRDGIGDVADVVLVASRALIGVSVRSIATVEDDLTLVQYRALVLMASRGEQKVSDLAEGLGVHPSTATRLCDRLVAKNFVHRVTSSESRREITLTVTPAGRGVLRTVTARRRNEIIRIVERLSHEERKRLRTAFTAFAAAAGEIDLPDDAWKLGWSP
jgi:DNA-binding MarR family transcriptional regulator